MINERTNKQRLVDQDDPLPTKIAASVYSSKKMVLHTVSFACLADIAQHDTVQSEFNMMKQVVDIIFWSA